MSCDTSYEDWAFNDEPARVGATHMEKYTEVRPVIVEGFPDAHTLLLKLGNQRFTLGGGGQDYYDTKEDVDMMRDMLCVALDQMVRDNST